MATIDPEHYPRPLGLLHEPCIEYKTPSVSLRSVKGYRATPSPVYLIPLGRVTVLSKGLLHYGPDLEFPTRPRVLFFFFPLPPGPSSLAHVFTDPHPSSVRHTYRYLHPSSSGPCSPNLPPNRLVRLGVWECPVSPNPDPHYSRLVQLRSENDVHTSCLFLVWPESPS